ncbi:MAG: malto-oligosyltrehalose synthase, partial [Vicinamibacterales bacterium]
IPDIYQCNDLWEFSLVDPDNRRPIDYGPRRALLDRLRAAPPDPADLLANWTDGRVKLWLTQAALTCRRDHPDLFLDGDYLPLDISGRHREHLVAFARHHANDWAVILAPRLTLILAGRTGLDLGQPPIGSIWDDTAVNLPPDAPVSWREALTGATIAATSGALRVSEILTSFPMALILADGDR